MVCVGCNDKPNQVVSTVLAAATHPKDHVREGVMWLLTFLPGALDDERYVHAVAVQMDVGCACLGGCDAHACMHTIHWREYVWLRSSCRSVNERTTPCHCCVRRLSPLTHARYSAMLRRLLEAVVVGLSDEEDGVRTVAMKAGEMCVVQNAGQHAGVIVPVLEEGLQDAKWRIRVATIKLLGAYACMPARTTTIATGTARYGCDQPIDD